jgi:hypothetical protein
MHFSSRRRINLLATHVADTTMMPQETLAMHDKSHLDFEDSDDSVEADGQQAAEERSKPVDPVVAWEVVSGDGST